MLSEFDSFTAFCTLLINVQLPFCVAHHREWRIERNLLTFIAGLKKRFFLTTTTTSFWSTRIIQIILQQLKNIKNNNIDNNNPLGK